MTESWSQPSITAYDLQQGTVELRPLTMIDIVDGAFSVCRNHKRLIAASVLLVMIPIQLLTAFFQRDAFAAGFFGAFQDPVAANAFLTGGVTAALITSAFTQVLVLPVLAGALVLIAQRGATGAELSGSELTQLTLRRSGVLIGAYIGLGLIRLAPFLLTALGFVVGSGLLVGTSIFLGFFWAIGVTPLVAVVTPALMAGDRPPLDAVRHAIVLARKDYWRVLGLMLLAGFVFNLLSLLLAGIPNIVGGLAGLGFGWVLVGFASALGLLIEAPLTAAAMVLLHQDLRVRQEGLDFDVLTRRLAHSS